MRAVFVGAGSLAVMTARHLLERGHEVVMIDGNKDRIDALAEELDCGFLHGDGSKPAARSRSCKDRLPVLPHRKRPAWRAARWAMTGWSRRSMTRSSSTCASSSAWRTRSFRRGPLAAN